MGHPPHNKNKSADLNTLMHATGLWRASSIPSTTNRPHLTTSNLSTSNLSTSNLSTSNLSTSNLSISNLSISNLSISNQRSTSTGFELLDRELPGNGWPAEGVTELLQDQAGIGELRLLTPALSSLSHTDHRWLMLVSPPYIPYAPALSQAGIDLTRILISQPRNLKDYLWVLEKALSSQICSAVIAWPKKILEKQVRRLQVASKAGNCWGVLFRPATVAASASPAELRIRLKSDNHRHHENSALIARVIKRQGRWASEDIALRFDDELLRPMPDFSEMQLKQGGPDHLPAPQPHPTLKPEPARRHEYQ